MANWGENDPIVSNNQQPAQTWGASDPIVSRKQQSPSKPVQTVAPDTPEQKSRREQEIAAMHLPETQTAPDGTVFVLDPKTGQYTNAELMRPTTETPGSVGSFGAGMVNGYTAGFADEALGAATNPHMREHARARLDNARQDHPIATTVGEIVGAVTSPGFYAKTLKGMIGSGAVTGALYGAGNADPTKGDGSTIGDALNPSRLTEAAKGAALGGATGAVVGGIGKAASAIGKSAKPVDVGALETAKTSAYKALDDSKIPFSQSEMQSAFSEWGQHLKDNNFVHGVDPKTDAAGKLFYQTMQSPNLTLGHVNNLRTRLQDLKAGSDVKTWIGGAVDAIDNMIAKNPAAEKLAVDARSAYKSYKTADGVQTAIQKAETKGKVDSYSNELYKYAMSKDGKRFLTAEQQDLLKSIKTKGLAEKVAKLTSSMGVGPGLAGLGMFYHPGAALMALPKIAGTSAQKAIQLRRALEIARKVSNQPMEYRYPDFTKSIDRTTRGITEAFIPHDKR